MEHVKQIVLRHIIEKEERDEEIIHFLLLEKEKKHVHDIMMDNQI